MPELHHHWICRTQPACRCNAEGDVYSCQCSPEAPETHARCSECGAPLEDCDPETDEACSLPQND